MASIFRIDVNRHLDLFRISRVRGLIVAPLLQYVCMKFAHSPCALGVSLEYSGFLPQSKGMLDKPIKHAWKPEYLDLAYLDCL